MPIICPKCSYARKETDNCPLWQCPSCQVAYSKVGDTQYALNGEERPSRPHFRPERGTSSNQWIWVVALALILAVAWQVKGKFKRQPGQIADEQFVPVRSTQPQPEVTLYSASWCGYCKATRNFFKDNGIRFTEFDVERTAEGAAAYKKLGARGVPVILIGEETVRGFSEDGLRQMLGPWMKEI